MNKYKRVGIYVRVSTKDRQDLEVQLLPLRQYAMDRSWEIKGEWQDRETGSKEDRAGLLSLMDAARKRKIDTVLVFRFDRFARSTKQLLAALDEFRTLGVDFCSYSENVDTTTPAGKVMFTMISAFAEFEKAIIQERVRAGLNKAKAKGVKLGRPATHSKMRERISELKEQGLSLRQIVQATGISLATASRTVRQVFQKPPEILT